MSFNIDGLDELQDGLKKAVQKGVDEVNKGLDRINNPDATESTPTVCPNCSAKLSVSRNIPVIKCEYCGSEFNNTNRTVVDSVIDFVEKQQKIVQENINNNSNIDADAKIKAREIREKERANREAKRLEHKVAKQKAHFVSGIIKLGVLGFLAYIYFQNQDIINPMIRSFIMQFTK